LVAMGGLEPPTPAL